MMHGQVQARLKRAAFDAIAALAYRESGLKLVPEKITMVQSRLRHRLRALQIADFETYCTLVCSDEGADERRYMISSLTTNVSHFFREPHHFDLLAQALRPLVRCNSANRARIRIWSAGCSNGQEPYSIAMHLLRAEPDLANADFKILATDIDPAVLAFAQRGAYAQQQVGGLSKQDRTTFTTDDACAQKVNITEAVRDIVTFRELNLLAPWPMRQRFDAIFCRNVVIYFDAQTQERLWPRFHDALGTGGQFFLGHSERIASPAMYGFRTIGPTAYIKTDAPGAMSGPGTGE